MLSEWRSNVWMIIELIIVFAILQIVYLLVINMTQMYDSNKAYNFDRVYFASLKFVPEGSDTYEPYDSLHSYYTDKDLLLGQLESHPCVEMVAATGSNAIPYNFNFYGNTLYTTVGDSTYGYYTNNRYVTPEYIKLIDLRGENGETSSQLAEMIERGELLISRVDKMYRDRIADPELFLNRDVWLGDTTQQYRVGAIVGGMRRNDFEPLYAGTNYVLGPRGQWPSEVVVKIREGMERKFRETLTGDDKRVGNVYVTEFVSMDDHRQEAQLTYYNTIRGYAVSVFFVMVVIFLGFFGSFWFRTQQRVGEIAVRKVCGATRSDILRRFIGEGLVMLGVATIVTPGIVIWLLNKGILEAVDIEVETMSALDMILPAVIAVLTLAIIIIAGVYIPARRAMSVDAAYALKDQ